MRFLSQTMLKIMFLAIRWFVFFCTSNSKLFEGKSPCAILDLSLPPVGIRVFTIKLHNVNGAEEQSGAKTHLKLTHRSFQSLRLIFCNATQPNSSIIYHHIRKHNLSQCLFRICVWAGRRGRFKRMVDTSECLTYGVLLMDSIPCEVYYVSHVYLENQHYCLRMKCSHRQAQTKIPAKLKMKTCHVTKDCERKRPQKLGSEEKTNSEKNLVSAQNPSSG